MFLSLRHLFVLTTLATLALLGPATLTGPVSHANPAPFTLYGSAFSPPTGWGSTSGSETSPGPDLTVASGETVDMTLFSDDGVTHNWGVDYDNDGIHDSSEPISSNFGTSTSYSLVATTTPGTYQYYCFFHPGVMFGSFLVSGTPDFTITANPTTVGPLNVGAQGTSMISVSSLNGFAGTVDLTVAPSSGLMADVSPPSISGGTGSSTLTVSAVSAGSFSVTVTGTSGLLSHFVEVTVNVVGPDFSLSATPSLSVAQGSSGNFTVTLQSVRRFSGSVTLTVTVSPAGPSVSASPGTVALADGGVGSAVVTVSAVGGVYSSVSTGLYTVTVTGTSGPVSHSVDVVVTVGSTGGSGLGSVPLSYVLGGVAGVVGVAGLVVFIVRRGRPKKTGDMA